MQPLAIKNGFNFRDIGGYKNRQQQTVKYHKLIRSGSLAQLSDEDLVYLSEYGMRYDVDFRSPQEKTDAPDRLPKDVDYQFTPVFPIDETRSTQKSWEERLHYNEAGDLGKQEMKQAYSDIVLADSARQAYRKFFDILLANDTPNEAVLFHCSMGKDRTGMGAVYLLSALDVDFTTIRQDYLASNTYLKEIQDKNLIRAKEVAQTPEFVENIRWLGCVCDDYLDHAVTLIEQYYGSIDDYLRNELLLTAKQRQDLQRIYLE